MTEPSQEALDWIRRFQRYNYPFFPNNAIEPLAASMESYARRDREWEREANDRLNAALALAHEALRALIPLADEAQSAIDHTLEERLAGDLAEAIALAGRSLSSPAMQRAAELNAAREAIIAKLVLAVDHKVKLPAWVLIALAELERLEAADG